MCYADPFQIFLLHFIRIYFDFDLFVYELNLRNVMKEIKTKWESSTSNQSEGNFNAAIQGNHA